MKKHLIWEVAVLLVAFGVYHWANFQKESGEDSIAASLERTGVNLAVAQLPGRLPTSVGERAAIVGGTDFSQLALKVASDYLDLHKREWQLREYHRVRGIVFVNPLGARVKFSIYQDEIPLQDMSFEFQIGRDLTIDSITNHYRPVEKFDVEKSKVLPFEEMKLNLSRTFELGGTEYAQILVVPNGAQKPELAYVFSVKDRVDPTKSYDVVVRASDGMQLLKTTPRVEF